MLVKKVGIGNWEEVSGTEVKDIIEKALGFPISKHHSSGFDFKMNGQKDHFQKKVVFRNKTILETKFTVNTPESTITYAYCTQIKSFNRGGFQEQDISPVKNKELIFIKSNKLVPKNKLDLAAYLLMYPDCADSLYKTTSPRYKLFNPQNIANSDMDSMLKINKWETHVLREAPLEKLQAYLQSKGRKQAFVLSESIVRSEVAKRVREDVDKFVAEFSSSDVNVKADSQKFVEAKLVEVKEFSGRREWRINFGDKKGDPVADIGRGQDDLAALTSALKSSPSTYDFLKNEYNNKNSITAGQVSAKKKQTLEPQEEGKEEANTPLTPVGIEAKVEEFINNKSIRFNPMRGIVELYKDGKKISKDNGGDLVEATKEDWVALAKEAIESNPEILSKL
jgi:hypothetical protein